MITGTDRILTADIEAVDLLWGLTAGKESDIHIICCKDFETGERFTFFDDFKDRENAVWLDEYEEGFKTGNIRDGIKVLEECEVLIMHNVSGYDALALEKTHGSFDRDHFKSRQGLKYEKSMPYKTMDTAVMSRVLNPERPLPGQAYQCGHKLPGPHTIEAHGLRMGRLKPEHEDWSRLTPEMIHRCTEDVEIGEDLFKYLVNTDWKEHLARPSSMTGLDIRSAYYCELRMAFTMARQEQRGFAIDVKEVVRLVEEMDEKIVAVEKAFRPNMPRRIKKVKLSQDKIDGFVNSLAAATTIPLSLQYEKDLERCDYKGSYATTYWKLVTQKGEYLKNVTKYIPQARGFAHEYTEPPVHGPFTPIVWEDIPLGNRDAVKQLLFKQGWLGVNYNDTELEYLEENGELPFPWSGKIDMDSMDLWEQSGKIIPDWCRGIGEWYIISSRRNQLLNAKDVAYFDQNQAWPRQASGKNECRGLLANAICFDEDSEWYMKTAQQFYERESCWPETGHWRVPAKAFHDATNTHRQRQKLVVNIPARGLYGKEMRGVFVPGPGKLLLGCDGAGLELRMLAHFMNDPAYQEVILNGDIHTHNQNLAGLAERDFAKTFIYAFLYGSGIPNLARQLGLTIPVVEVAVNKFKRDLPLLTTLLERVQDVAEKFGYLLAVDGRWGRVRSKGGNVLLHTALNVLLQMTGSIVMKWAHVIAEDKSYQEGSIKSISDFPIVVHMHDECQAEVDEAEVYYTEYQIHKSDWKEDEKRLHIEDGKIWSAPNVLEEYDEGILLVQRMYHPIGDQYCRALKEAGEFLKLRCPIAGEYKIGHSWADTH
jgi:hypothetical protein